MRYAGAFRTGDLLLYIDPAKRRASAAFASQFDNALLGWLAGVPLFNGLVGSAVRADWTSVACIAVIDKAPYIVAYDKVDDGAVREFSFQPAGEFLATRGVATFAVRPLFVPGSKSLNAASLNAAIANFLVGLNSKSADDAVVVAAKQDDVRLASELYGSLTNAHMQPDEASRMTVAQLFGTGGLIDSLMITNSVVRFQLAPEILN